jgi:hypothetical protein
MPSLPQLVGALKTLHIIVLCGGLTAWASSAWAQIDPVRRDLVEIGYNQPLNGHAPLSAYGYYYLNRPEFLRTNLTLRLAIAPVYLDGELGIRSALGANTDLGIGVAGGGFADSYDEIRQGKWLHEESFTGHGALVSASVYHLFNPGARIPLNGLLRAGFHYSLYERDEVTAPNFVLPPDQPVALVRAGLRWGGIEPVLAPELALEVSAWYEGQLRLDSGRYGYANDRFIEPSVHRFWGRAALAYTLPDLGHQITLSLNAGTTIHPDRFSAYRLGGQLALASEFPFSLPGYYYNELSARNFLLVGGGYTIPFGPDKRWSVTPGGFTGMLAYTPGEQQSNLWNSGVGITFGYESPGKRAKYLLAYGYGIDAIRSGGRGGHSLAFMLQLDLEKSRPGAPEQENMYGHPGLLQRLIGAF